MKIKNIIIVVSILFVAFSCSKDDNTTSKAQKQSDLDDGILIEYLSTHYLDEDGGFATIANGETSLKSQVQTQSIVEKDVSYNLYYLLENQGVTTYPNMADSVYVKYTGMLLDSTVFDSASSPVWLSLTSVIAGWRHGFTNYKGGNLVVNPDESFYFEDFGKGILFIPSGLAYGTVAQSVITKNSPLIFQIELHNVNEADHDQDGIISILEDIDNDGIVTNDDTDKDGIANYLDVDDDNDGILTKDEDTTKDTDGDGILDHLDKDN